MVGSKAGLLRTHRWVALKLLPFPEEPLGDVVDACDDLEHLVPVPQQSEEQRSIAKQLVHVVEVTTTTRRWETAGVGCQLDCQAMDVDELLEQRPRGVEHLHLEGCEVFVLVELGSRLTECMSEQRADRNRLVWVGTAAHPHLREHARCDQRCRLAGGRIAHGVGTMPRPVSTPAPDASPSTPAAAVSPMAFINLSTAPHHISGQDEHVDVFREPLDDAVTLGQARAALEDEVVREGGHENTQDLADPVVLLDRGRTDAETLGDRVEGRSERASLRKRVNGSAGEGQVVTNRIAPRGPNSRSIVEIDRLLRADDEVTADPSGLGCRSPDNSIETNCSGLHETGDALDRGIGGKLDEVVQSRRTSSSATSVGRRCSSQHLVLAAQLTNRTGPGFRGVRAGTAIVSRRGTCVESPSASAALHPAGPVPGPPMISRTKRSGGRRHAERGRCSAPVEPTTDSAKFPGVSQARESLGDGVG